MDKQQPETDDRIPPKMRQLAQAALRAAPSGGRGRVRKHA